MTAIFTGCRAGELIKLRWDDIDLSKRIKIIKSNGIEKTKSGKSRIIPILNSLYKSLLEWKLKSKNQYLFYNNYGHKIKSSSDRIFQEVFRRVLERANLGHKLDKNLNNKITFHDLRHTFASHWIMKNGDIYKLQKILGHSSLKMTERYAHLSENAFKNELNKFDSILIPEIINTKVFNLSLYKNSKTEFGCDKIQDSELLFCEQNSSNETEKCSSYKKSLTAE